MENPHSMPPKHQTDELTLCEPRKAPKTVQKEKTMGQRNGQHQCHLGPTTKQVHPWHLWKSVLRRETLERPTPQAPFEAVRNSIANSSIGCPENIKFPSLPGVEPVPHFPPPFHYFIPSSGVYYFPS